MTSVRTGVFSLVLAGVVSAILIGIGAGPERAAAAILEPCESTSPTGPIVTLDGELTLENRAGARKAWRKAGIRQKLIKPANSLGGRPTFPVLDVRYGAAQRVNLKGGLRIVHKKRKAPVKRLQAVVRSGKPSYLRGKAGGATINFLVIRGGRTNFDGETGELFRTGTANLTRAGARYLNKRLKPRKKLKAGTPWGSFDLFSIYKVTQVEDPTGETPPLPPVKEQPLGAQPVTSAATIKWFVRDTFIDYVSSGEGTRVLNGATADPVSGPNGLVYSFNFPFQQGWTVPGDIEGPENTLIKGTGGVGFKYCHNTINFTVSDPEIEIDGDTNSRLIFHVNGTDGTPFPDQRAVVVKLMPGEAAAPVVTESGGVTTVTYDKIPGYIPAEATGIFAGFYPAYSSDFFGVSPRPDRFGYLSISYSFTPASS